MDLVISVPDSGTAAALGFAEEAGIPFEEGLMKPLCGPDLHSAHPKDAGVGG